MPLPTTLSQPTPPRTPHSKRPTLTHTATKRNTPTARGGRTHLGLGLQRSLQPLHERLRPQRLLEPPQREVERGRIRGDVRHRHVAALHTVRRTATLAARPAWNRSAGVVHGGAGALQLGPAVPVRGRASRSLPSGWSAAQSLSSRPSQAARGRAPATAADPSPCATPPASALLCCAVLCCAPEGVWPVREPSARVRPRPRSRCARADTSVQADGMCARERFDACAPTVAAAPRLHVVASKRGATRHAARIA